MLGTIQKANHVISLFTEEKPEWGVTEIANLLSEPKSTVHELLSSLAQLGWLARTDKGRYRLGSIFFTYSRIALNVLPFKEEAHRTLQVLADRFGEMAQIGILANDELMCADAAYGPMRGNQAITSIGAYFPAYAFAMGKVLLAHSSWEKVHNKFEKRGLVAFTPNTITKLDQLKTELDQIRQQGYAVSQSEYMREWSAVAAPVYDRSGKVIAAISTGLAAPRYPMLSNELIAAILSAANDLSKNLGFVPSAVVLAN